MADMERGSVGRAPAAPAAPRVDEDDDFAGPDGAGPLARGRGRRGWLPFVAGGIALVAVAYFGWRWWEGRNYASTDDAQVGGDVVPVLARVSGYVRQVLVNENDQVKAGQLLVVIDDSELRQRLAQAQAQMAMAEQASGSGPGGGQARAQAQAARANARSAQAGITQAAANAEKTRRDLDRLRPLAAEGIVSRSQFDAARAASEAAQAQLDMARNNAQAASAQAQAAQSGVGTATQQVEAARANLAQAQLQLAYARIDAPSTGVVARKSVQVGQLVNPGQALMTVVPLSNVWVTANLKETQLKGIAPGSPAEVTVDAYPGMKFQGRVESISPATGAQFSLLPPENATGNFTKVVQRVPVRIRLNSTNNPGALLRPGMSAEVSIRKNG